MQLQDLSSKKGSSLFMQIWYNCWGIEFRKDMQGKMIVVNKTLVVSGTKAAWPFVFVCKDFFN